MSTLPYLAVLPSWRRALPLAAASLLALSLAGCNSDAADAVAAPPPTVSVAPVSVRKIVQWDEFNGRVEAVEGVALRPRVSGYIDRVNYEEGQIVKRGDVLFEIDARSYRAALARAE
ncbi:biotin/lipoyl-binding protein, partial [Pseudomonas sp. SST3]